MHTITLPELGEDINEATVACWHFKIGDDVKKDDDLLEVVTDKATFNIHTETSGQLKEIRVQEGELAEVGQALAVIG